MLDRQAFVRPIAHRGLHDATKGVIENSEAAFTAAVTKGYGIECDLRPAADGTPMVFHDQMLGRLIDARGKIGDFKPGDLKRLTYKGSANQIMPFADLVDLVDGQVPLLVEIKSEWQPANPAFLKGIVRHVKRAKGAIALMSFDPVVMAEIKALAPKVPRGIVSGLYKGDGWWLDTLDPERAFRLSHLIESGPVAPNFYAYHVKALPTPVTRFIREVMEIPLFSWTVRTETDLKVAEEWADAPIFESLDL